MRFFLLVYSVFKESFNGITNLVPFRLRAPEDEIADIRVCHDIADNFLDADIRGLQSPGECSTGFNTGPHEFLDPGRDLFGIVRKDNDNCRRGIIVPSQVPPLFGRILRVWLYFKLGYFRMSRQSTG